MSQLVAPAGTGWELHSFSARWRACLRQVFEDQDVVLLDDGDVMNLQAALRDAREFFGRLSAWWADAVREPDPSRESGDAGRSAADALARFPAAAEACDGLLSRLFGRVMDRRPVTGEAVTDADKAFGAALELLDRLEGACHRLPGEASAAALPVAAG